MRAVIYARYSSDMQSAASIDGNLTIDLYCQIASILRLSTGTKGGDVPGSVAEQLVVVAGACIDRDLKCFC
jgi:hypothetical protein